MTSTPKNKLKMIVMMKIFLSLMNRVMMRIQISKTHKKVVKMPKESG